MVYLLSVLVPMLLAWRPHATKHIGSSEIVAAHEIAVIFEKSKLTNSVLTRVYDIEDEKKIFHCGASSTKLTVSDLHLEFEFDVDDNARGSLRVSEAQYTVDDTSCKTSHSKSHIKAECVLPLGADHKPLAVAGYLPYRRPAPHHPHGVYRPHHTHKHHHGHSHHPHQKVDHYHHAHKPHHHHHSHEPHHSHKLSHHHHHTHEPHHHHAHEPHHSHKLHHHHSHEPHHAHKLHHHHSHGPHHYHHSHKPHHHHYHHHDGHHHRVGPQRHSEKHHAHEQAHRTPYHHAQTHHFKLVPAPHHAGKSAKEDDLHWAKPVIFAPQVHKRGDVPCEYSRPCGKKT